MKIKTLIIFCCLIIAGLYGFFGPNENEFCFRNWENVSVTITIIYAIVFYVDFMRGKDFNNLKKDPRFFVVTFLILVFFITVPFSSAFFGEVFNNTFLNEIASFFNKGRIFNMWLLTVTALLFLLIDIALIYSGHKDKDKFLKNMKYSEIPVFVSFGVLLLYSYHMGVKINKHNLDLFFGGAVAFELISSNIIWLIND